MPYRDDEGELHPHEYDEDDADDDLASCDYCGAQIHEQSEQCPACGRYQSLEDPPRKPWWIIVGLALCLAMALGWAIGG